MAEFQKVTKEYRRMCNSYLSCENCPLVVNVQSAQTCKIDVFLSSEESERIIMQWAAERPLMTNRMKFREVFGKDIVICEGDDSWLDQEYKGGKDEQ